MPCYIKSNSLSTESDIFINGRRVINIMFIFLPKEYLFLRRRIMIFFGFMYLTIRRYIVSILSTILIPDDDPPTVRYYYEEYIVESVVALSYVNRDPKVNVEISYKVRMFFYSGDIKDL